MKEKYYYSIVNRKTGTPLLEDHKLPVYWSKKVAQETAVNFSGFVVKRINAESFRKFINDAV